MTRDLQFETEHNSKSKTSKLILGIILDGIGMMSYLVPVLAEATDLIWAPIAAYTLSVMYKGYVGKIGGFVTFIEEIIPGLDFIPTFTLTWFYEYYFSKKTSK